jgi:hypothetical protein
VSAAAPTDAIAARLVNMSQSFLISDVRR